MYIIINTQYKSYIIAAIQFILCIVNNLQILTVPTIVQLYYIANEILLEEHDKDENEGVTWAAANACLKRRF